MHNQDMIERLQKDGEERALFVSIIDKMVLEKDARLVALAEEEAQRKAAMLANIEKMEATFRAEGESIQRERDHLLELQKMLKRETVEPLLFVRRNDQADGIAFQQQLPPKQKKFLAKLRA